MPKKDVAFVGAGPEWYLERFARTLDLQRVAPDTVGRLSPEERAGIRALICAGAYVPAELVAAFPNLGLVANSGAGYEKIDVAALRARGIALTNSPSVTDDCVADLAFGLLLAVGRHILQGDNFVRSGAWTSGNYPLTRRVSGRRMGILGLGRIGKAIATRAEAFKIEVGYFNRKSREESHFLRFDSLREMAAWADILVIACPGGPSTFHLVDQPVLEALGPEGVLVNISRGSVVDEAALIEALQNKRIAGAGLDVFEHEPEVPEALRSCDNVVLMPHRGGGTVETWEDACDLTVANVAAYLAGKPLLTPVFLGEIKP